MPKRNGGRALGHKILNRWGRLLAPLHLTRASSWRSCRRCDRGCSTASGAHTVAPARGHEGCTGPTAGHKPNTRPTPDTHRPHTARLSPKKLLLADYGPDSATDLVGDATAVMGWGSWWGGGDIWSISGARSMRAISAVLVWALARVLARTEALWADFAGAPACRSCRHRERTRELPDSRPRVAASCVTAERCAPVLSQLTTASRAARTSSRLSECNLSSQRCPRLVV